MNLEQEEVKDSGENKELPSGKKDDGISMELLAMQKEQNKRLVGALKVSSISIVVIVLLFCATVFLLIRGFFSYLSDYDFNSYDVHSEDGWNASYIGNDGDIYNGESDSQSEKEEEKWCKMACCKKKCVK